MSVDGMIAKTGLRQEGFRFIANALYQRQLDRRDTTIVETGCARQEGNWCGDGQSTIIWTAMENTRVISFDTDQGAVNRVNEQVGRCVARCQDGVVGLSRLRLVAHLVYLDSFDVDMQQPHPAAWHALQEFMAAMPLLREGSLLAIDDNLKNETNEARRGKGMYVAEFMDRIGKPPVYDGYQIVWRW
jgi:hypothetical protein